VNVYWLVALALVGCDSSSPNACEVPAGADSRVVRVVPKRGVCTRYPFPLAAPRDVVEARDGSIYVTEMFAGRVSRLDANGFVPIATGLASPIGLRESPSSTDLLVGEESGNRVSVLRGGARTTLVGALGNVTYVAVGSDGALYASSFTDLGKPTGVLHRIDLATGNATDVATDLSVPEGIATRGAMMVVVEWGATPSRVVAEPGGAVVASNFVHAYGVARAPHDDGWIVADAGTNRVVLAHDNGPVETLLDGVAAPAGVFVTKSGDVLIAEHVDGTTHDATGYLIRLRGL
jgi:hypothetical protein